jgi:hypothetical protein
MLPGNGAVQLAEASTHVTNHWLTLLAFTGTILLPRLLPKV